MRRLSYQLPQLEATVGFFGDVTKLKLRETDNLAMTWPQLKTDVWTIENVRKPRTNE